LLHHLEVRGIFVSTGSACSSRKNVHSHVLKAMGLAAGCIEGAIRFSFSLFNTKEDVLETVAALREIVPKIRTRK
jgi:cysteine desulfurase